MILTVQVKEFWLSGRLKSKSTEIYEQRSVLRNVKRDMNTENLEVELFCCIQHSEKLARDNAMITPRVVYDSMDPKEIQAPYEMDAQLIASGDKQRRDAARETGKSVLGEAIPTKVGINTIGALRRVGIVYEHTKSPLPFDPCLPCIVRW